eukprot:CAMPEP_0115723430 /NCGR_PEP_ID=MMETSP0272-20121206/80233_1 /TAXON_ID=71861 /ORGANISM="Scrippsiella trochoidea, Strain CCMP3099" /LENGTH=84 /DNA_ID=CAMNT_0003166571 /DNA_START=32 /DNA_END=284 /DNA_ORIENTATION=+
MACPKAAAGMQECSGVAGCGSDDEASDLGGMLQLRASGHEADDLANFHPAAFVVGGRRLTRLQVALNAQVQTTTASTNAGVVVL